MISGAARAHQGMISNNSPRFLMTASSSSTIGSSNGFLANRMGIIPALFAATTSIVTQLPTYAHLDGLTPIWWAFIINI